MTLQDWSPIYARLCAGLGRKETPAQMRAYYDALHTFPTFVVTEAVKRACSKTWPPTHPHAGDVVELSTGVMRERAIPGAVCDVCNGSTWTVHHCGGVSAPDSRTSPAPVERSHYCGRDWVHADHDFARRCPQCWMLGKAVA